MGKRHFDGRLGEPSLPELDSLGPVLEALRNPPKRKAAGDQGVLQFEQVTRGRFEKSEPIHRAGPG